MSGFTHESQAAQTVEWYTPKWIFDELNTEFDLDCCAPIGGVPYIPAKDYISLPTDSLKESWNGFVWCNPPYGKETPKFLSKMLSHNNGIALVFSRTDTKWFHDYVSKADCVLYLKGRVQFHKNGMKAEKSGSTCGSMLVGYGEKATKVLQQAKHLGTLQVTQGDNIDFD